MGSEVADIVRERMGEVVVFRMRGGFERAAAWTLRDRVDRERERGTREVVLDFSDVRDFSDLAVAVLAHGLTSSSQRVLFRGLRQHQLRIFRYCGVAVEELGAPTEERPDAGA